MKSYTPETSLAVQWLRLHAPSAEGMGSTPGWGTKPCMPNGVAKKKRKEICLRMTDFLPSLPLIKMQVDHTSKRISDCRWVTRARQCPGEKRKSAGLQQWKNDRDFLP